MNTRLGMAMSLSAAILLAQIDAWPSASACAPVGPKGVPVVNADQTVIIIWDPFAKMQHFIRQASFTSDADDFGFLVPSPTRPELAEAGNDAFPFLSKLTEPKIENRWLEYGSKAEAKGEKKSDEKFVKVLEQKLVAGFHAVVLETNSTASLVGWLKENSYAFSPEVETWAKPYVDARWIITALKVAKDKENQASKKVSAAALRLSFKTDRPLFPYREPDSRSAADLLDAKHRLLRIYFIADARYEGALTKEQPWTGKVAWAGQVQAEDRARLLALLQLPPATGPAEWWLTEFEDDWPYRVAEADVYFSPAADQEHVRRTPIVHYQQVHRAPSHSDSSPDVDEPSTDLVLVSVLVVVAAIVFCWFRRRHAA